MVSHLFYKFLGSQAAEVSCETPQVIQTAWDVGVGAVDRWFRLGLVADMAGTNSC